VHSSTSYDYDVLTCATCDWWCATCDWWHAYLCYLWLVTCLPLLFVIGDVLTFATCDWCRLYCCWYLYVYHWQVTCGFIVLTARSQLTERTQISAIQCCMRMLSGWRRRRTSWWLLPAAVFASLDVGVVDRAPAELSPQSCLVLCGTAHTCLCILFCLFLSYRCSHIVLHEYCTCRSMVYQAVRPDGTFVQGNLASSVQIGLLGLYCFVCAAWYSICQQSVPHLLRGGWKLLSWVHQHIVVIRH